jgi:hypothetical protein
LIKVKASGFRQIDRKERSNMSPLFYYHAQMCSEDYLAKLHRQEPNPYDLVIETAAQRQVRQSPPSWRARFPRLLNGRRLERELSAR